MSLLKFQQKTVQSPRGAWTSVYNRRVGTPSRATVMQNMRVQYGTVRSRPGTSAVFNSTDKVTGLFNWITPSGKNLVLYQDGDSIKSYEQTTAESATLVSGFNVARAPSFAPLDVWVYFTGYDTQGNGTVQCQIYDGVNVDKAFPAPPDITGFSAVDGGAGFCTQGTHFFGFVYQNRTGYAGVPTTSLGEPFSFTTDSPLRQVNITVSLAAQSDGGANVGGGVQATLFLIATRVDNPGIWYFIPTDAQTGQIGEQPVPLNTPVTLNFVFSLSDEDIATSLAGDTAQANFLFLTQDANGNGPFDPSFVVAYGQRMCYGAGTTLYVSDIANPQQIAADTNAIRMQNQRAIGAAFQLPGSPNLYVSGDRWTGYVNDNSDSPSTWGEPIGVSDALGAALPCHVCAATGGNYVWIVTESGPYYFDGTFTANQMLYLISGLDTQGVPIGWDRVNWNAAYAIQIKDDVANLKLYIAVPLDGAAECNYMFVIDYRMGKTFETVDIGIETFTQRQFSSIGVVKEISTGLTNLWIGPAAAGTVNHFDIATHNDVGNPIQCIWQSGQVRGAEISTSRIRVGYLDIWARGHAPVVDGNSTLGLAIISMDLSQIVTPDLQGNMGVPATLSPLPGIMYSAKFDLTCYNYTVAFQTNAVDAWMEISGFTAYQNADISNR